MRKAEETGVKAEETGVRPPILLFLACEAVGEALIALCKNDHNCGKGLLLKTTVDAARFLLAMLVAED